MRKVEYDYEPEVWEMLDKNGKRADLINQPDKLTDKEFIAFLEKDRVLTEEEAVKLN